MCLMIALPVPVTPVQPLHLPTLTIVVERISAVPKRRPAEGRRSGLRLVPGRYAPRSARVRNERVPLHRGEYHRPRDREPRRKVQRDYGKARAIHVLAHAKARPWGIRVTGGSQAVLDCTIRLPATLVPRKRAWYTARVASLSKYIKTNALYSIYYRNIKIYVLSIIYMHALPPKSSRSSSRS